MVLPSEMSTTITKIEKSQNEIDQAVQMLARVLNSEELPKMKVPSDGYVGLRLTLPTGGRIAPSQARAQP